MGIVTSVLMMRTWAIYNRRRVVLVALVGCYALCFIPSYAFYFITKPPVAEDDLLTESHVELARKSLEASAFKAGDADWMLKTCFSPGVPRELVGVLVSILTYETGLFLAMMYRLFSGGATSGVIKQFYLDAVAYYVFILLALGSAIVGCIVSSTSRAIVASRYFIAMRTLLCSHMILRLRSYYSSRMVFVDGDLGRISDDSSVITSTGIHFARRSELSGPDLDNGYPSDNLGIESGVWTRELRGRRYSEGASTVVDLPGGHDKGEDWSVSPAPHWEPSLPVVVLRRIPPSTVDALDFDEVPSLLVRHVNLATGLGDPPVIELQPLEPLQISNVYCRTSPSR
ncbi:hypothetical protein FRB99_001931 [Tulasnella sp. 403]|nr:hypothetical protein FRB99_001931 [Tulasnella sp. 403]